MKPVEVEFLMKDKLSGGIDSARMKADLLDASLKKIALTVGGVFSVQKAVEFGKVMMDVRGQIESFQISFDTLIGSKDRSAAFFKEIKDFAVSTPLMLDDLARSAQTFLGFGIETERVIPILKQIGDVTMGNKERFGAMSLAFAQMYATGKLQGQDLLQMINAGFNPLIAIAEKTGKSVKQLKEEMSEGAISAEMVAQAFADVTAEGGKFHGMLEAQSKGIEGMKAKFSGAVQDALNEMGTASQGIVTKGMEVATTLVQNYETVGKVLVGLIATYGAYKAAVIAVTTVEQLRVAAMVAGIKGTTTLGLVTDALKTKFAALNKTMLANPYVLLATAVVALGAAIWALHDNTTAQERAQKRLNDTLEAAKQKKSDLKGHVNELIGIIKDETQTIYAQVKAYEELKKAKIAAFEGKSREQIAAMSPEEISKAVNQYVDAQEVQDANAELARQEQLLANINSTIGKGAAVYSQYEKEAEKLLGLDGFWKSRVNDIYDVRRELEANIEALKKHRKEQEEIAKAAEFDAKPLQERIAYYNQEIEKLDTEKRQLDTLLLSNKSITDEWGNVNLAVMNNIGRLEQVNKLLNEMKGKVSALKTLPANTNYGDAYATAEKNWKDAQKALAAIEKNKKNYTQEDYSKAKSTEATTKKAFEELGGTTTKKSGGSGMTAAERANVLKAEQKERERQIEEYTAAIVTKNRQSEFEIRKSQIDAMKDGIEKERAAIALKYDQLEEENRLREEQWIKDLQAKTNTEYEKDNPDWKKKGLNGPKQNTAEDLTGEQQKLLQDFTDENIKYRLAAEEKLYQDLLGKYKTFAEQYYETAKKYQDDIDRMKEQGMSQENIAIAEQEKADALVALDEEFAQKEDTFKDLMARIGSMSLKQLYKTLKEAEDALKNSNIDNGQDSKQSATLRAKIKKLQEEIKAVNTENEIEQGDQEKKWKKTENAIKDCKAELDGIISSMDNLDEGTKIALQAAQNVAEGAIAMISGIKMLAVSSAAAISTVEKASVILTIISAAIQIITAIFNMASAAEERHQEALKEIANEKLAFQREYNMLLLEQNELLQNAETIMGTDSYGKAIGSIQQMYAALDMLNQEIKGEGVPKWLEAMKDMPVFGDLYKQQKQWYEQGILGLANISVKTGHEKTGLFGWGKGRDIYSSVLEVYPDLLDANGKFNASLAKTIMETRTMSDTDKAALQQMIDLSETMEEAFESVKEYLTDIFGELGNTMSDALVDAFRNGTNAAQTFTDSVTSMLETLAEQMIYSVMLQPLIDKASDDMLAVMSDMNKKDEEKFNEYVGILDAMTNGILGQQSIYEDMMEEYQRMAKEKGLDLWQSDSVKQSGKAGAYETASQDSITRLEGLYTSMLEHEISIDRGVENIAEGMSAALGHLQRIEENTDHLSGIKTAINTMRDDIATIKRDGVKTR
jgi:tape measure domain-containing protein